MLECITDATIEYAGYTPVRDSRGERGFSSLRGLVTATRKIACLISHSCKCAPAKASLGTQ